MEDMQTNLGKLKALSEDDKLENVKLRSRIDEQCQLIMVLKQKADDGTIKIQTLDRMNKELSDFRDKVGKKKLFVTSVVGNKRMHIDFFFCHQFSNSN